MHKLTTLVLALAMSSLTVGVAAAQGQPQQATAELKNAAGQVVGSARFTQTAAGVRIRVDVANVDPGAHGLHIHAVGRCDPPDFTSAGGHFNPLNVQHGLRNPLGAHAGDLPNLQVGVNRASTLDTTNSMITLGSGATSLFDADGSALVIHAMADDEVTDPTGNSGGRVACAVITLIAAGGLPRTGDPTAPLAPLALPAMAVGATAALLALGLVIRRARRPA